MFLILGQKTILIKDGESFNFKQRKSMKASRMTLDELMEEEERQTQQVIDSLNLTGKETEEEYTKKLLASTNKISEKSKLKMSNK